MAATELQQRLSSYLAKSKLDGLDRVVRCIDSLGYERVISLLETLSNTTGAKVTHLAAYTGNTELITTILDRVPINRRADVLNIKDNFSRTAFHWVCIGGHSGTFAALFEHLPDSDVAYNLLKVQDILFRTPVHYAAYSEEGETMEYLLRQLDSDKWFDLVKMKTRGGINAIIWAAAMNWTDKLDAMLRNLTAEQKLHLLNTEEQLPEILEPYKQAAEDEMMKRQTQANQKKIERLELEDLRNKKRIAQLEQELALCKEKVQANEVQHTAIQQAQEETIFSLDTKCEELHMQLQQLQNQASAMTTSVKKSLAKLADCQQDLRNGTIGTDMQVEKNRKEIEGLKLDIHNVDSRQLSTEEQMHRLTEMLEVLKNRLHELENKPG